MIWMLREKVREEEEAEQVNIYIATLLSTLTTPLRDWNG
jgi:hypothetical protein